MYTLQVDDGFQPPAWLSSPFVQTTLATRRPRCGETIRAFERPILLDAGPDLTGYDPGQSVRLLAYFNPRSSGTPTHGAAVLLHGWEGSSHSTYNLLVTQALTDAGYDVFRLNLRDHGPNLHYNAYALNRGFFLGTLLEETECAVHRLAELAGAQPLSLIGSSMGGNFVLRLGIRHRTNPLPNLASIVAVNPAINPQRSTAAVDRRGTYRRFFRRRWLRSLRTKQRLFPELYDFSPLAQMRTILEMTEYIARRYSPWQDAHDYFSRYTVTGGTLEGLDTQTTIITAFDDEIVPVVDFYALAKNPRLTVRVLRYGGHMGYLAGSTPRRILSALVLEALEQMRGDPIRASSAVMIQSGAGSQTRALDTAAG